MMSMNFDGRLLYPEFSGNLFVQQSGSHVLHHITFPGGERIEPALEVTDLFMPAAGKAVAFERLLNGIEQILFPHGLRQELYSTGFHRPHAHRDIGMTREKNNRNIRARVGHPFLKIQPAKSGHPYVEHEAGWPVVMWAAEEFLSGGEHLYPQSDRASQVAQRFPHRRIIIYDKDDPARIRHTVLSPSIGKVKWNLAPRDSLAVAHSRPPWASMIEREIASPIPNP